MANAAESPVYALRSEFRRAERARAPLRLWQRAMRTWLLAADRAGARMAARPAVVPVHAVSVPRSPSR